MRHIVWLVGILLVACSLDGPTEQYVASMVFDGKLFYMACGFPTFHVLGIRPDGRGNVTDTHVVWKASRGVPRTPSPLLVDDLLYMVADNGILTCLEAATGQAGSSLPGGLR